MRKRSEGKKERRIRIGRREGRFSDESGEIRECEERAVIVIRGAVDKQKLCQMYKERVGERSEKER